MSATIHPFPRNGAEPSLEPLMALVADGMNSVNAVILDRMQSRIPLIPALAGHLIAGGGKRMRPMLTLSSAALLDYAGNRHHKLAAAVEFIHTATLLHDDVVDGSDLRRGKHAANIVFGNPATVLVGDFLFSRAFELMVEDGSLKVLRILSNASAVIAEGEVDQLTAQRQIDDQRGTVPRRSSAPRPPRCSPPPAGSPRSSPNGPRPTSARSTIMAATSASRSSWSTTRSTTIRTPTTMGKGRGDDFREGKMTLPVILAYARGDEPTNASSGATPFRATALPKTIWPKRSG